MGFNHIPVMVEEICSYLPQAGGCVADFTIGGGGHSFEFLKRNDAIGLVGVDRDPEAIRAAREKLKSFHGRFELIHASFSEAAFRLKAEEQRFDFILADLGFSSFQIDTPERGFSFLHEGPLDMRMNPESGITAAQLINQKGERELARIIQQYGEERFAFRIARQILIHRKKKPLSLTTELVECVKEAVPQKFQFQRTHPATKTFQAFRVVVNEEIRQLGDFLRCAIELLNSGGRIAIITFHSLEDRPVKQRFREWENPCTCPVEVPVCVCGLKPQVRKIHKKVIQASKAEIAINPRARSAKLRIVEKL